MTDSTTSGAGDSAGAVTLSVRWGSGVGAENFRRAAVFAESAGFDQIWTGNDLFRRSGIVPTTLALDDTSRIKVGSSVLNPVTMHPAEIADVAAALQDHSGGRFLLGIGAGSEVALPWAGLRPGSPLARTRTALRAIKALLAGGSPADVPGAGEGWHPNAKLKDGPPAPTPVYLGAMGPKLLQLAGREADGVIALCLPPTRFHWVKEQIEIGSGGARPVDLGVGLWISVGEDQSYARRLLARAIALYSGALAKDALEGAGYDFEQFRAVQAVVTAGDVERATDMVDDNMLRLGITGSMAEVNDRCLDLIDQGARHISFGNPLGPDPMHSIEQLGNHVLPVLRKAL